MRGECPTPRPECPYHNRPGGCFSDTHHLYYPGVDYSGIIDEEFRELPENKEQICRWEHDIKQVETPPEKPNRRYMLGRIATALAAGEIHLSKRKTRKLGLAPRGTQNETNYSTGTP